MELPFDHVSLEFESFLNKPIACVHTGSEGKIQLFYEESEIINPDLKNYFRNSLKKLIPKLEVNEIFTLKSIDYSLFNLILKIDIEISESEYIIEDQLDRLLKWFPLIFDFFPEVPRLERIITNIPINGLIKRNMAINFLLSFEKIKSLRMADYNFHSFLSEYPRLTNSNILKRLDKNLHNYYKELFWDFKISIHPFNFYGKIPDKEKNLMDNNLFGKLINEYNKYLISLYSYIGEAMDDFLKEVESFRYRMNPLEFKNLIRYEDFFEEIYNTFFLNEIPEWSRTRFEKWVFEHYKDDDFYANQPVMIYKLHDFPKNYIKLRMRIQEILNNIKTLLLSKSNLIKTFKKEELRNRLKSIKYEKEFRNIILIPILKDLGYENIQDIHGPHEYGVDILFSNMNKFGLMEWNGIVAKIRNINFDKGTKISQNLKKIITQIYQAKFMNHLEKNYGDVKLTRVFVATNGTINYHARNILSQKDPLIEGSVFFIDKDTFMSLF